MLKTNTRAIRAIMTDHRLNQTELAKKLGVSRAYICRLLAENRRPSANLLSRFKRAFPQYSLDYYFYTQDVNNPCQDTLTEKQ